MNMKRLWILGLIFLLTGCKEVTTDPNGPDCSQNIDREECVIEEPVTPLTTEEKIEELISQMTLREKAGQMVQAERSSITPADLAVYQVGSILSGGGSHPTSFNDGVDVWLDMVTAYQDAAMNHGQAIPILYGIDAVHGHNNLYGATIFPHNIGLGAAGEADLVYRISKATAEEMLVTGIPWTFAPALSIVQNIAWGRTYEGYGEHPEIFEAFTKQAILGFEEHGVSATAKHYLADGATIGGIDQGDVWVSDEKIRDVFLLPYIEAVEAEVDTIMISFSSIKGMKMHEHAYYINDVLKEELGFEGFVISDWNAIHQLEGSYEEQVRKSINAGVDMLMEPYTWKEAIEAIVFNVNNGYILEERIDDAVSRILKVKFERGLFEDPVPSLDASYLYSEDHKALAREAVQKSLVLLKNDHQTLPLDKDGQIYLTGTASDHVGYMSGGWTTYWQGNTSPSIGVGTSIKDAFTQVLQSNDGALTTSYQNASTVVVVLSEIPYTEGVGDNQTPSLNSHTADPANLAALEIARQANEAGKQVVGILISGRPMLLEDHLDYFDAFVAAWLPGSEGGNGIADVLFGDVNFTGILSYTWPKTQEQLGYNVLREDYDEDLVLFPYGFGLTYE
jgi:beta-glucosidase